MYLGLDLGTSGLKGILIDADQQVLAEATAPLTVSRPQEGWSEQAPADWIGAAEKVLAELSGFGLGQLRGIGLSGQMHGATLLDASDDVLRPCILWNDTRSFKEAAELDADCCLTQRTAVGGDSREYPGTGGKRRQTSGVAANERARRGGTV